MRLHRSAVAVLGALSLAVTMGGAAAATANAASIDKLTNYMLSASGYGTKVSALGGVLGSDRTAPVGFGCTRRSPLDHSNNVAGVDLGALGDVGAVTTHVTSSHGEGVVTTESTTTVADASLLSGAIVLEGLEVIARTYHDVDGYHAETETSAVSLTIGGEEIIIGDDELEITLPGIATIVVNGTKETEKANRANASATGLKITLLGGEAAVIVVGSATAGIDGRLFEGRFAGQGYGSTVEIAGVVESGKTAKKSLPCLGTNGEDKTNSVAEVVAGPVTIGAIQVTVNGDASVPEATVTTEIGDVEIELGPVAGIAIRGIKAVAHVEEDEFGVVTTSAEGSTIAEIVITTILGIEVPLDIPDDFGVELDLLGLGTLQFMTVESIKDGRGIAVTGAMVDVPALDLNLTLAYARASIK